MTSTTEHGMHPRPMQISVSRLIVGAASIVTLMFPLQPTDGRPSEMKLFPVTSTGAPHSATNVLATRPRDADLILIPAGSAQIGDDDGPSDEHPAFVYTSRPFLMDRTPVTVAQFAAFVRDTGYKTDAERFGSAGVLDHKLGAWIAVKNANWRRPAGRKAPAAQGNRPVTQVSWFDANTFCSAYGLRLPTEFEWERAARLGQTPDGHVFKVGDLIERGGHYLLNAWQGRFPLLDTGADGYRTTSPVGAFGTASSGLTDMAGNVWQWTSSWYLPYSVLAEKATQGYTERVARGGSFLCSPQLCQGYRASARNHATPDTSLENIGFRCAADPGQGTALAGRVTERPLEGQPTESGGTAK